MMKNRMPSLVDNRIRLAPFYPHSDLLPRALGFTPPGDNITHPHTPMKTRITLFALALALPFAACETEPDTIETNTTTIETPDVDATMDNVETNMDETGAEMEESMNEAGAEMEEAGNDMEAAATEAGAEMEEAVDGDNNM